jgi:hypothetical protein
MFVGLLHITKFILIIMSLSLSSLVLTINSGISISHSFLLSSLILQGLTLFIGLNGGQSLLFVSFLLFFHGHLRSRPGCGDDE